MNVSSRMTGLLCGGVVASIGLVASIPEAEAALVNFQSYNGKVDLSTDGFGSMTDIGDIRARAPSGSTVLAAYLYTSTFLTSDRPTTVSFANNVLTYDSTAVLPAPACCDLQAHRTNVTSLVKPVIDGGGGGIYNFAIDEGSDGGNVDGHALVVVYSNPTLPEASVGILDGFARVDGDTTSINFAEPLNPTAPGFFADMILGIGFSCCGQASRVMVNGQLLTNNAGNFDDGDTQANGSLITVGSFDDPYSIIDPNYADDRERYDLSSFVTAGDTSIKIDTFNATRDDLIFLAAFKVSGEAGFNEEPPSISPVPIPASGLMLLGGLAGLVGLRRRSDRKT